MLPVHRILAPTDFSDTSVKTVRSASELAEHFGAELLIVHVTPPVPTLPSDPQYDQARQSRHPRAPRTGTDTPAGLPEIR